MTWHGSIGRWWEEPYRLMHESSIRKRGLKTVAISALWHVLKFSFSAVINISKHIVNAWWNCRSLTWYALSASGWARTSWMLSVGSLATRKDLPEENGIPICSIRYTGIHQTDQLLKWNLFDLGIQYNFLTIKVDFAHRISSVKVYWMHGFDSSKTTTLTVVIPWDLGYH